MKKTNFTVINSRTQEILVQNLWIADTFFSRFIGLMGSDPMIAKQGLLISPCKQIHTHFMAYTVDVIFLDHRYQVVQIVNEMKPWGITKYFKSATHVLELCESQGKNIHIGDTLIINKP